MTMSLSALSNSIQTSENYTSRAVSTLEQEFSSILSEQPGDSGNGATNINILSGDTFTFNNTPYTSYGDNDPVINGNQDSPQSSNMAGSSDPLGALGDIGGFLSGVAGLAGLLA
jgi:hypothetical protein